MYAEPCGSARATVTECRHGEAAARGAPKSASDVGEKGGEGLQT